MLLQPTLETLRLRVAPVDPILAPAMLDYQIRNRAHLAPWDPTPGAQFFTLAFWQSRCRLRVREWQEGRCASFVLQARQAPQQVIGTVSLSQIQRGVAQYAMLGYGLDQRCEGKGLMFEALQAVLAFAFDDLKLHRLQANYQPANLRSAALLARLGFQIEGRANQYLFLDGAWRDHVMTALINPNFDASDML
ncbi:GNAT family N-acetyltransferase [Paludibacterium purpuratum]|uniref:[SSU ribosomal protein S5P]-alanine acetyltransferase n=1 Tax=Paludibacterium purpuratum TaxID=1144873 RepID=A0A4R7B8W0_9NEIS|nr:GNAT family N-acetyltransferase [Paludibacterium purpuratum]TDR80372.1 [SSU ribosomal protein S5P]-alanine acetyltransferase [Paludibacterium purpuratum]